MLHTSSEVTSSRIWGITAYFNPLKSRVLKENFLAFRRNLILQKLPLLVVELARPDQAFELTDDSAELLIQVRAQSVLWQKERLLNIGRHHLPVSCDQIVWLDCDIIFGNDGWVAETSGLLKKYNAVQPFEYAVRLPRGNVRHEEATLAEGNGINQRQPSDGKACVDQLNRSLSHPGYAWAARRSIFDNIGLHDRLILGASDTIISNALCGFPMVTTNSPFLEMPELLSDLEQWYTETTRRVGTSVYFTTGTVFHLYHGSPQNRQYWHREFILKRGKFDPSADLKLNEDDCWEWASYKPKMHREVKRYFWQRNDDSLLTRDAVMWVRRRLDVLDMIPEIWRRRNKIPGYIVRRVSHMLLKEKKPSEFLQPNPPLINSFYGVYFLANDDVYQLTLAFLKSFRQFNPSLELCLIPFNNNCERIKSLGEKYKFSVYGDARKLALCDEISEVFHHEIKGHYRKLCCWFGKFDRFIYIDVDTVVLAALDFSWGLLNNHDYIASHSNIKHIQKYVWKNSIYSAGVLSPQQIDFSANTGFFISKKIMLNETALLTAVNNAATLKHCLALEYFEQSFLNFLIVTTTSKFTSLLSLKYGGKLNNLPLEYWAGCKHGIVRDGQMVNSSFPYEKFFLVHWAGLAAPLHDSEQAGEFSIPYQHLWKYYYDLELDESTI